MAIGLGHNYMVQVLKTKFDTLEECLRFIEKNKPSTKKEWIELRPLPNIKNKTCDQYQVSLVKMYK